MAYGKSEEVVAKLEQLCAGRALGQLTDELKQRRRHRLVGNNSSSYSSIARGQARGRSPALGSLLRVV
jgi:hypothetical protein